MAVSCYKHSRSSVNRVCDSKARHCAEDTRTESSCSVVRIGISEAEVTNDKKLCSGYCSLLMKLTTDRREASQGLFATAELFATQYDIRTFKFKSHWISATMANTQQQQQQQQQQPPFDGPLSGTT